MPFRILQIIIGKTFFAQIVSLFVYISSFLDGLIELLILTRGYMAITKSKKETFSLYNLQDSNPHISAGSFLTTTLKTS